MIHPRFPPGASTWVQIVPSALTALFCSICTTSPFANGVRLRVCKLGPDCKSPPPSTNAKTAVDVLFPFEELPGPGVDVPAELDPWVAEGDSVGPPLGVVASVGEIVGAVVGVSEGVMVGVGVSVGVGV